MRQSNQFQNTGAWFNDRTGKLTGSRMASAMAFLREKKSKDGTPAPREDASERKRLKIEILAERMTGNIVPKYVTADMQWGIDTEPLAKEFFTVKTGLTVKDVGFIDHPSIDNCGVSPDGVIMEERALIEIKCPKSETILGWHLEAAKDPNWLPEEYLPQMGLQSACFGGIPVYFCAFDPRLPDPVKLLIRKFEPSPEYIKEIESNAQSFLNEIDQMFDQLIGE